MAPTKKSGGIMKRLFAALAAVTLLAAPVHAADPVKVIVPFAAGGPVDALARILAAELSPRLQTDVVVENIGGAGGLLAVDRAAAAPADGRTILFASVGAFVITNALKPRPGYDQLKSFAPVARVGAAPTLFIVKADSPIKSLPDLIAKAKGGDKLSYGSAGNGTTMHIVAEQLNASAGTKITHVPYRGIAPALNDIMGGHINFLNGDITVLYPLVKQGSLRALAVAGTQRSSLLPDVPTAQELGYKDVYMENWYGALVPAATPPDVVAKLEAAIMEAVKTPEVWAKISANGVYNPQDAKAFRAQIEKDVAYWGAEIKKLGITAE
jgi:tripartite-type tricarboxylate transporter receptor subunit TctC